MINEDRGLTLLIVYPNDYLGYCTVRTTTMTIIFKSDIEIQVKKQKLYTTQQQTETFN